MAGRPWLRKHWPDALLREHLRLHPYSLVQLRRAFWRDYFALDPKSQQRLGDLDLCCRLGFLHGVIQMHMGREFYGRWLEYVGYTDWEMAAIHYGDEKPDSQLLQRILALFGLMPWWLLFGTPPAAGQLLPGEEVEIGRVGGGP